MEINRDQHNTHLNEASPYPKNWLALLVTRLIITYPILASCIGIIPLDNLVCEAIASISPYLAGVHLLALALIFLRWHSLSRLARNINAILILIFLTYYGTVLFPFYQPHTAISASSERDSNRNAKLKLLYANIDSQNKDYQRFIPLIQRENPDIIVLFEAHYDWKNILSIYSGLPYSLTRQDNLVGRLVFSRYPIQEVMLPSSLAHFASLAHIELSLPLEQKVSLLAVDALAPMDQMLLRYRNDFLEKTSKYIGTVPDNVILAADLNVTIFSRHYRRFIANTELQNAAKGYGLRPTWRLRALPFITAKIDHLAFRGNIEVESFQVLEDVGSDHYPLLAVFRLDN